MNNKIKFLAVISLIIISLFIIIQLSLYFSINKVSNTTVTTTETSVLINTSTISITSTITTTVTQSSSETLSINLVNIQENKAASWNKPHLTVLVFPNNISKNNQNLEVNNAVVNSINQWQKSILAFTANYNQYSYLSQIKFTLYITGINDSLLQGNSNIRINFVEDIPSSLIGETQLLISDFNIIQNANITVTTKNLTLIGIQNVLTHELGHVFGLNHSLIKNDIMYFEREKNEVKEIILCPSTLDVFAIALLYHWIETPSFHPFYMTSVTLPDSIPYNKLSCELT